MQCACLYACKYALMTMNDGLSYSSCSLAKLFFRFAGLCCFCACEIAENASWNCFLTISSLCANWRGDQQHLPWMLVASKFLSYACTSTSCVMDAHFSSTFMAETVVFWMWGNLSLFEIKFISLAISEWNLKACLIVFCGFF